MRAVGGSGISERARKTRKPTDELRIAVTFRRPQDRLGPTRLGARLSSASVASFAPDPLDVDRALYELNRRGFNTTARGRMTASIRGPRSLFETTFGTKLARFNLDPAQNSSCHSFYFPPPNAVWN